MEAGRFRKLNIELPIEKITNDRPWLVAGLLITFAFLMLVTFAYLHYLEVV